MNRCRAARKTFVLRSLTSSKCTALIVIQIKTVIYCFTLVGFQLRDWRIYTGPQKSKPVFENSFEEVTLALGSWPINGCWDVDFILKQMTHECTVFLHKFLPFNGQYLCLMTDSRVRAPKCRYVTYKKLAIHC